MNLTIVRRRVATQRTSLTTTFRESWNINILTDSMCVKVTMPDRTFEQVIEFLKETKNFNELALMFDNTYTDINMTGFDAIKVLLLTPENINKLDIRSWFPPVGDWSYLINAPSVKKLIASQGSIDGLIDLSGCTKAVGSDKIYK